jgi:hypothetical protein
VALYGTRTEDHLVHDVLPAIVRAVDHGDPRRLEVRTKDNRISGGLLRQIKVCLEHRYGSKDVSNSPDAIDNSICLRTQWRRTVFWGRMSDEKQLDVGLTIVPEDSDLSIVWHTTVIWGGG